MSNTTINLVAEPYGEGGKIRDLPVDGGAHIYNAALVSQLNATSMLCPGGTASSGPAIGVSLMEVDNTDGADAAKRCDIETDRVFILANATGGDACSEATPYGSIVYMYDDHTIADNSAGATRQPAGFFDGMEPDGRVRVFVTCRRIDADTDLADLAGTSGAGMVGILDAGGFTAASTVEAALAELYQNAKTAQAQINVPLTSFVDADGDPLAKFIDGASTVPGFNLADSEAFGIRWNNHATPGVVLTQVALPQDLDDAAAVVVHVLASKVGATLGDAVTFLATAFFHTVGAAHDADANAGGTTGAMTGNATTKTVQEVTLSIAAGDVPASPGSLSLTLKPTDGTLGTDDVIVEAVWLEYTRKILTS